MRLLHLADTHLGAAFSALTKEGRRFVKEKIEASVSYLGELLTSELYDGLILVGDIFESERVSPFEIKRLEDLMKRVLERGGFVVYATGNHDCFIEERHFKSLLSYPKFLIFTGDEVERKSIEHRGRTIAFYGIGYRRAHPERSLNGAFPPKGAEQIAIGILHGDVFSGAGSSESPYYSVSASYLASLNYDYFALGHIHSFQEFGNGICYPGTPFPHGFDETGKKTALSVDFGTEGVSCEKISICKLQFYDLSFHGEATNLSELADKLRRLLAENLGDPAESLVRIRGEVAGCRERVSQEDEDFMDYVFGGRNSACHLLALSRLPSAQNRFSLPKEFESCMDEAILELLQGGESCPLLSKLDLIHPLDKVLEERDLKAELIEMMRRTP